MTLPIEAMRRRPPVERHDVAVVGAGLAGLVCAGVLARGGARVVLVDAARRPGGRLQTVAHQGYAVDLSPPLWEAEGLLEALAAAGVSDPPLAAVSSRRDLRVAVLDGGAVRGGAHPLPVPGAVPSPAVLDAVRALYAVAPRTWAGLGEACALLPADASAAVADGSQRMLAQWAAGRAFDPAVSAALQRSAALFGTANPANATVPWFARQLRRLASEAPSHFLPASHPIAGSRALVQSLVDAVVEAGVDLRLGTRVVGLELERGRLRRLTVQREELPFLAEVGADRAVLAVPGPALAELLPAELAAALPSIQGSGGGGALVGFAFALRARPWAPDDEPAPLLRLVAPVASGGSAAPGAPPAPIGLCWPGALAPGVEPPGQALLLAHLSVPEDTVDPSEVRRLALLVRSALRDLYPEAAIAWERSWVRRGESGDPLAVPRLPEALSTHPALRLAGWSVGVPGQESCGATGAALSGRAAAEALLAAHAPG